MATTGAVLYFRPPAAAVTKANRVSGAVALFALRESTGLISATGIIASTASRNRKALKPHRSVPPVGQDGLWTTEWDSWFQYLNDTFLAMSNGPTLPDVAGAITESQARSIASEVVSSALSQMVNSNAQSLSTMVEVAKTAALPGSEQIPPVQLSPLFESTGGE